MTKNELKSNLLDFLISSSSLPRRSLEIAETLGTVLLSQIFSLINLRNNEENITQPGKCILYKLQWQ